MSGGAKAAYRPVGIVAGVAAGALSGRLFKVVWKRIAGEEDAPGAMQSEYTTGHVLLAAAIQGAIFGVVKAGVDRFGAQAFTKLTGTWPGD